MDNIVQVDTEILISLHRRLEAVAGIAALCGVTTRKVKGIVKRVALSDPRYRAVVEGGILGVPERRKGPAEKIALFFRTSIEPRPGACLYALPLYRVFCGWWSRTYPAIEPPSQKIFGAGLKSLGLAKTKRLGRTIYHDVTLSSPSSLDHCCVAGDREGRGL